MEEMGDDEVFALIVSLIVGVVGAAGWYARGLGVTWLGASPARRWLLVLPIAGLAALWYVLDTAAAVDVRNDFRYQFLFVAMGTIWVFHLPRALVWIGISYRDDALERRNGAAAIAIAGAVVAFAIVFTGSNMGEGPSIWNTVQTALAATAFLAASTFAHALVTSVGDTITIERDVAAGVRFAGWMVASGVVLARGSAGDWVSASAMIDDLFAVGWPILILLAVAVAADRALRPSISSPRPPVWTAGVVPAGLYLAGAMAYVGVLPGWGG